MSTPVDTVATGTPWPLISLFEVKDLLRKSSSTDDDTLTSYLLAASSRIQQLCLPLGPTTVTDTFDGDGSASPLCLSTFPVNAVTSVAIYGSDGTPSVLAAAGGSSGVTVGYRVNKQAGTVTRVGPSCWPVGYGNVVVAYTAGPSQIPPEVAVGVKLYVQAMWDTRSVAGNLTRPGNEPEQITVDPVIDVPAEVISVLSDWLKPPRVA